MSGDRSAFVPRVHAERLSGLTGGSVKFFGPLLLLLANAASACELCAVYSASNARGEAGSGLVITLSEQYISEHTRRFNGKEIFSKNGDYLDSSMTHFVPGFNFSQRFGVSLNVPVGYLNFRRTDIRYSLDAPPVFYTEKGSEFGLGDVALIGRFSVFQKSEMEYGFIVNLLAGVKFPTGDASRLDEEIEQTKIFDQLLPPNTPHDPLSHSVGSIHPHDLALGSGSYDGIFGLTLNARWQRWFLNGQFQYALRTEGRAGFRYGDEIIVSGGPGGFLLLKHPFTLSLQCNTVYDCTGRDELLGRPTNRTRMTAWYLGPLISFTWGEHFSATAGVDIPVHIENNGFRNVPDYRVNAGITWRF